MYLRAVSSRSGRAHAAQLEAEGDVAQHVGPRQQREILEHERALGAGAVDRLAFDQDLAGIARDQAGDDLEQRGLAAAARTEQGRELALGERQVDVAQRLDAVVVGLADVLDFDESWRTSALEAL